MPSLRIAYRRAEVTGFWIVVVVLSGVLAALGAALIGSSVPWAWGLAAAVALPAPGLVRREWFEGVVWAWNGSVKRVTAVLRRWILFVCYFILFTLVARAGSSIRGRAAGSGWLSIEPNAGAPARDLAEFCRREHAWVGLLAPMLVMLALLGDESQDGAPPSSTYTLY